MRESSGFLIRLLRLNRWTTIGAALAATSSVTLLATLVLIAVHPTVHPFVGVLWPLTLPALTALGIIVFAWGLVRRGAEPGDGESGEGWRARFRGAVARTGARSVRQLAAPLVVLVALPLAATGLATLRTMNYMETPVFCGQACHVVMDPQWVAYQESPHANVPCTRCHIGTSLPSLVQARMQGAYELLVVLTGNADRPVGPPALSMAPWEETCAACHRVGRDYEDRIVVRKRLRADRDSTPAYGIVNLKLGSDRPGNARGIHWHAAAATAVEFASDRDEREVVRWVRVTRQDGSAEEFFFDDPHLDASGGVAPAHDGLAARRMDCYDCHNRAGHRFQALDEAVTDAVTYGRSSPSVPFAGSRARKALSRAGARADEVEIGAAFRGPYSEGEATKHGGAEGDVARMLENLTEACRRNIHPAMRVTWGTYPDHIGHADRMSGCFRCHNQRMRTRQGRNISQKCSLCHDVIAEDKTDLSAVRMPAF